MSNWGFDEKADLGLGYKLTLFKHEKEPNWKTLCVYVELAGHRKLVEELLAKIKEVVSENCTLEVDEKTERYWCKNTDGNSDKAFAVKFVRKGLSGRNTVKDFEDVLEKGLKDMIYEKM